jgi:hypothetical protein
MNLSSLLLCPLFVVALRAYSSTPPTRAASFQGLGDFPGGWTNSTAYGISPDGSVVIGRAYPGTFGFDGTHEAYSWTAQSGFVHLGFAPGDQDSVAWAASAHGETIVGDNLSRAIIWEPRHGMRRLREALIADYGLNLTGWELTSAHAISPDGNTIAGSGINPAGQYEAWIATGLKPTLTIRKTNDTCWLSWPAWASDFILQSSGNLVASWSNVVATVITNGSSVSVTQTLSGSTRFFRLAR